MKLKWRYIVGMLGSIVLVGVMLPSRLVIEREIAIDTFPATVFALVNDFRQISRWSAWLDDDPNARIEYSGPQSGVGATLQWSSQIIGDGRQTIMQSTPYATVTLSLDPDGGMVATTNFSISRIGNETKVIHRYERELGYNLFDRYLQFVLDDIVAAESERSLERLKRFAEEMPKSDFSTLKIDLVTVEAGDIAYLSTNSIAEASAIAAAMGDAYYEVLNFIDRHELQEAGAPLSITRHFDGSELAFDAAIPVSGIRQDTPRDGPVVKIGTGYSGTAIRVRHIGPFRTLGETHEKIAAWLAALGMQRNGDAWEVYISDPTTTVEAELLTHIYYPVRSDGAPRQ